MSPKTTMEELDTHIPRHLGANARELLRVKTAQATELRKQAAHLASPEYQIELARTIADLKAKANGIERIAAAEFMTREYPDLKDAIRESDLYIQRDSAGEVELICKNYS